MSRRAGPVELLMARHNWGYDGAPDLAVEQCGRF
jgi:hypothetical protein